tara:strand:- start:8821 stop:9918 length:1098 start_codon:yes stop_codon:yes gene_type:complete
MKNKILFLLHLPPPVHGSSMVGKWIQGSALLNEKFSCCFINLLASKKVSDTGKVKFSKITSFVIIWLQLLKTLIVNRPKLVYVAITATGFAFYRDVLFVFLIKVFKVKRVYHMHNKGVSINRGSRFHNLLYSFVFKNAEVILLSQLLYNDVSTFVSKENIHICPNGISPFIESIPKVSKEVNKVKLLFLSNLIETKGVNVLLDACSLLKEKGVSFECVFIGGEGDINAEDFNLRIKSFGLKSEVSYVGKKYGKDKYIYMLESDIFVFPTYYSNETFGLVNLEAMQARLPVVSTDEGGIPDVVVDGVTGFIIPKRNPIALAEKLEMLIQNPKLRLEMGEAGYKKYKKEFTLEVFEQKLSNILHKLV